jgi:hypothetical protein
MISIGGVPFDVRGPGTWSDGVLVLDARPGAESFVLETARRPDHVWLPHLAPTDANAIADAVFRAPAVLLTFGETTCAFVPDLDDVGTIATTTSSRVWLDYDHRTCSLTVAVGAYREDGHVFFVREPPQLDRGVRLRVHVIVLEDEPYAAIARWLWSKWGRAGLERPPPALPALMDHAVRWAFHSGWDVWQTARIGDRELAGPVFIIDVTRHPSVPPEARRWREPRSFWNQAWFSMQRCANGLLRHARRIGSSDLVARAKAMTEIALAAPDHDGFFPSVLVAENDATWRWTNSDRRPPAVSERAIHLVDAAFTCRMLLEWGDLTADPRAERRARRFADRLVRAQLPSGAFPGWIEPDGSVAPVLAEGPESAVSALLLFELGQPEPALRALPSLIAIADDGRWEDFETYFSCARWGTPGERVTRNGVYKQNTLGIAWCAEAFLHAYRVTRDDAYLRLSRRCMGELSLYQAVWSPPWLSAPAHGGFGVMNADSEWNDARQSLFAPLYFELARETGDRELFERGVAAMRASFSMMYAPENPAIAAAYERRFPFFGSESYGFMMENQAHGDPIGTFTIFSWGNGSALATAATVRDRYPEAAAACGL